MGTPHHKETEHKHRQRKPQTNTNSPAALAQLRQRVPTTATLLAQAPAAATDMRTDDVQRKRKDTLGGRLSKSEFDGDTEDVKLAAEDKLLLREARKKTKKARPHPGSSRR